MSGHEALGVSYRAELCRHLLHLLDSDALPHAKTPGEVTVKKYREKLIAVADSNGEECHEPCVSRAALIAMLDVALADLPEYRYDEILYDGRNPRARRLVEWWEHRQRQVADAADEKKRRREAQAAEVAARKASDALKSRGYALLAAMDPHDREALRSIRHEI